MKKNRLLNRNEIVQGPSPEVIRAIREFDFEKSSFYFEGYYGSRLVPELSHRFKIPEAQISVGYGIEFFLRAIFDSCDPQKDIVLTNPPHFGYYTEYAKTRHVRLATSPLKEQGNTFAFDIPDMIAKIKKLHPKIILITSPNNPTGNSIAPKNLTRILRTAKKNTLVALDEAYWGFDRKYNNEVFLKLIKKHPNLVIFRGFSKHFALAGFRIGFALWGKQAKKLVRFENLYLGGSRLLEEAALAAFGSQTYYRKLSAEIIAEREWFTARVNRLKNFKAYASNANFVLVKVEKKVLPEFKKQSGMLAASISKFVMPEFLRVTLGFHKDVADFAAMLAEVDKKFAGIW